MAKIYEDDDGKMDMILNLYKTSKQYAQDPSEALEFLKNQENILRTMDLARENKTDGYLDFILMFLQTDKPNASTRRMMPMPDWTYKKIFHIFKRKYRELLKQKEICQGLQSLSLTDLKDDNDEDLSRMELEIRTVLHVIFVFNLKLQDLLRHAILFYNPKRDNVLNLAELIEAQNFERLKTAHMTDGVHGQDLPVKDIWDMIKIHVKHFDHDETVVDYVELGKYIQTKMKEFKTEFEKEYEKYKRAGGKSEDEFYQQTAAIALGEKIKKEVQKKFVWFHPVRDPEQTPFGNYYANYYKYQYQDSVSDLVWSRFCIHAQIHQAMLDTPHEHIYLYNLASEDDVKNELEKFYSLEFSDLLLDKENFYTVTPSRSTLDNRDAAKMYSAFVSMASAVIL